MNIDAINEALELLRIAQSGMGPDPGYLDRHDRHRWNRISKCIDGLEKLRQHVTVAIDSTGKIHMDVVEPLYAAPVPAAVPDGWKPLEEDEYERRTFNASVKLHGGVRLAIAETLRVFAVAHRVGSFADLCRIMANEVAMLSVVPAAPAVPDVDWLSNVIRAADGGNNLGAGALAEKIVEAMQKGGSAC